MSPLCVEIVCIETIKPSSPTPSHLNTWNLSFFDQQLSCDQHHSALYISLLVFFTPSATPTPIDHVRRLKKSLSETLTLFYPFAGRLSDNYQFIHCNDDGVDLVETRVNTQLAHVLSHPTSEELVQLLPNDGKLLLSVQINVFDCGGIVLGLCLSHNVADTCSAAFFLNTWAATAKKTKTVIPPEFGASVFFPASETEPQEIDTTQFGAQPKLVTKRFVFNASTISTIRDKCSGSPTRVEAVSAYVWRCWMNASRLRSSALVSSINLRPRMSPPLGSSFVGNLVLGILVPSESTTPPELDYLVGRFHKAVTKIDSDYVRKVEVDSGVPVLYDAYKQVLSELSLQAAGGVFGVTSWCRFPFYEADFGCGKPEWVTTLNLMSENVTILMDTKCGTGIEAWVTLKEEVMTRFEHEITTDLIMASVRAS